MIPAWACLPVDLAEHDVLRADDGHDVSQHVAADHLVKRGEVGKPGARTFTRYGLLAPSDTR